MEAVSFFDTDNDGIILQAELASMMNSFAKSESTYINSPAEINEINRIGRSIAVKG